MKIIEMFQRVDPATVGKLLPDEEWQKKFESLKKRFQTIIEMPSGPNNTPELVQELDTIADGFRDIYTYLAKGTELAAKARLNEAVLWADSLNLERAIYLAGIAEEKDIKEPYRTQIKNLPSHACMTRYRQSFQVAEWIQRNIQACPYGVVAEILESWQSTFLAQFNYFATNAYVTNPKHNQAVYHKMLASLLLSRALKVNNKIEASKHYEDQAYRYLHEFTPPQEGMHYMQAIYLQRASKEFSTFGRLSAAHPQIKNRLDDMANSSTEVQTDKPREFYPMTPYLVSGMRAASLAVGVCGGAAAFGHDVSYIHDALADFWNHVTIHVIHAAGTHPVHHGLLADTGGMAGRVFADSGGMAVRVVSDSGGLADRFGADSGGMALLQSINLTSLMA